jgi:farnesyl-diphosphate farnesyltransferase
MLNLTSHDQQYLTDAMGKVSRSFAIVVAQLEEPLNLFMATAYLICRVADNIEDSLRPLAWQQQRFMEFRRMLHDPDQAATILTAWTEEKWPGLSAEEQALMGVAGGLPLWNIYAALPTSTQSVIGRWASIMAQGMAQLDGPESPPKSIQHNGIQLLASEKDYNRYCYFVAGTVGHLGVELVVAHYGLADDVAHRLYHTCEACGRGLQKTNIVKDFIDDLHRQICYLPATWLKEVNYSPIRLDGAPRYWQQRVTNDVLAELHQALDHVLSVPPSAAGYRKASLICLLPALHTLLLAAQNSPKLFTPRHYVKIPRETMMQCILDIQSLWADNDAIRRHCRSLMHEITTTLSHGSVHHWPVAPPPLVSANSLSSAPDQKEKTSHVSKS